MDHQKYKEDLHLYSLDELREQEKLDFENHLFQCNECSAELETLQKFNSIIVGNKPLELSDSVLDAARFELIKNLRNISQENGKETETILEKLKKVFFTQSGSIITSAATLIIGIVIGMNLLSTGEPNFKNGISLDKIDKSKINVNNIRFVPGANSDEIEIAFDEVRPSSYKGNINDLMVQELLATAVVKAQNPGVRIKSLQTISQNDDSQIVLDTRIKSALITAIKVDENPGVRREAISLLKKYPYDIEVRDALIYVLLNDNNSGLRVAAVNALSEFKVDGISIDKQLRSALDQAATEDGTNQFVKLRATSLLKED